MSEQTTLYRRISLEFLHQYPGHVFLRLEPHSKAPAIMFQVLPGDIVAISQLADLGPDGKRITAVEADELADDDFRPGDSGLWARFIRSSPTEPARSG
jgi:hypothetical protein